MSEAEYRYRNVYPAGPCTLVVRGEPVLQDQFSDWGPRLPEGTRGLDRGWLAEESRPGPVEPSGKSAARSKGASSKTKGRSKSRG